MKDKALHFVAGVVVGTLAMILFGNGAAITAAILAGAAKEVYDRVTDGTVALGDFIATGMGGMLIEAIALIGAGW
jgi:hypothetical protein